MTRRLLNLLTALSLLMCVAVVVLWVRGYWAADAVWFVRDGFQLCLAGSRGHVAVAVGTASDKDLSGMKGWTYDVETPSDLTQELLRLGDAHGYGGFMYAVQQIGGTTYARVIIFPLWVMLILLALPAAIRFVRQRLALSRRHSGACPVCGYDLRATPDRCPECGESRVRD